MKKKITKYSSDCMLGYILAHASRLISSKFENRLKAHGLTLQAWKVLGALYPDGVSSINELVNHTLLKQPTLTKIIERLLAKSLVIKQISPLDKRVSLISLSEEGRKLAELLIYEAEEIEMRALQGYTQTEKNALRKGLLTLIEHLEEYDKFS